MTIHDAPAGRSASDAPVGSAEPAPTAVPRIVQRFTTSDPERSPRNGMFTLVGGVGLLAVLWVLGGWSLLLVVFALVLMITLHELGHYVMAKRAGMKVTEFFLGFGPRLWSTQRGETEYGIKAIPAGAYVRIIGMSSFDEVAPEDEHRTYRQQAFRHRFGVAVAGSTMHFLIALVCIWSILVFAGAPNNGLFRESSEPSDWKVELVTPDSAAARAGVQPGDRILAIDGSSGDNFSEITELIQSSAGKAVTLTVLRDGAEIELPATVGDNGGRGFLGVQRSQYPDATMSKTNPVVAVPESVEQFGILAWESVKGVADKFSPAGLVDLGRSVANGGNVASDQGPVVADPGGSSNPASQPAEVQDKERVISIIGAVGIGSDLARDGWVSLVFFLAVINVFIGLVNLVPLLPFDGGHVVVAVYEKIRSMRQGGRAYHADLTKMLPVAYAVVLVLAFVGISSIYLDVINPISLN